MKVALLLDPGIEVIDSNSCGGTERAFLLFLDFLYKERIDRKSFSAAKVKSGKKYIINKLFYPTWLKEIGEKLIDRSHHDPLLWKIGSYIKVLAELPYCLLFIMKSIDCDVLVSFNVPLVSLLSPRRTILRIGYPAGYVFFPLQRMLKSRYQQTYFYFVSKNLCTKFIKNHPHLSPNRHEVIHNGIDTALFQPKKEMNRVRHKQHLTFLYASNWNKRKGIFMLLKAARVLEEKGLKFKLLLAGGPDLWSNIDVRRKAKKISERVYREAKRLKNTEIVGKKNYRSLPKLYHAANFVVFPSIWREPFGFTIIEAMSCATPVIAFKKGASPEIIKNNKTGYLISDVNTKGLVRAIQNLIQNETLSHIRQMGQAAREEASHKYSLQTWERSVKKLLEKRLKDQ